MYNVADDFWDSYFRHKQEMRNLRREATNSFGIRVSTSVVAKQVPDRDPRADETRQSNSYQQQDNSGERNVRRHSVTNINHSRDR